MYVSVARVSKNDNALLLFVNPETVNRVILAIVLVFLVNPPDGNCLSRSSSWKGSNCRNTC